MSNQYTPCFNIKIFLLYFRILMTILVQCHSLLVTSIKEVMFLPVSVICVYVCRITQNVFKQFSWKLLRLYTTVMGRTHYILDLILFKLADQHPFCFFYIKQILDDCLPRQTHAVCTVLRALWFWRFYLSYHAFLPLRGCISGCALPVCLSCLYQCGLIAYETCQCWCW